ncbi:MAG: hypothetical protein ACI8T1_001675 [Verrucomicrobiales bacterium]
MGIGRDIRDNNKPFNGSIDEVKIYDFGKSGAELATMHNDYITGGNDVSSWDSSPVVEIAAIERVGYNSTLADDASDLQLDPLTYTKVSGPAWLNRGHKWNIGRKPQQWRCWCQQLDRECHR